MHEGKLIADRYLIDRKLGQGGMSYVYVAHDTKFEVEIALKLAEPRGQGFDEFKARFKREAMIGRILGQHAKGFVRVLDWGEVGGESLYLVMDLIKDATELDLDSGSREDRIDRFAAAAKLVKEAHALGIIHRDLKPANFLHRNDGKVFLTDFGLAKIVDSQDDAAEGHAMAELTQSGMAMGTPYFMAPEQFDAKLADERADVYSLGVMLYQALTRELPYRGSLGDMLSQQERVRCSLAPAPSPRRVDPSVPAGLDSLCREALALDPAHRVSSTAIFVERLLFGDKDTGAETLEMAVERPRVHELPTGPGKRVSSEGLATLADDSAVRPERIRPPALPGLTRTSESEFKNDRDGSLLVWIPAGLTMTGDGTETLSGVDVPSVFIGKHLVTWAQYRRFCGATQRTPPKPRYEAGPDHPVHGVSAEDADSYCAWAGLRLPSGEEWSRAARGDDERVYPWGDEAPSPDHCNYADHPDYGKRATSPVGQFPAGVSAFGCHDMAGNVLEWLRGKPGATTRTLRGGAYRLGGNFCKVDKGMRLSAGTREAHIGFRVALGTGPRRRPTGAPEGLRASREAETGISPREAPRRVRASDSARVAAQQEARRPPRKGESGRRPPRKGEPGRRPPPKGESGRRPAPRGDSARRPRPKGQSGRQQAKTPVPSPHREVMKQVTSLVETLGSDVARTSAHEVKFVFRREDVPLSFVLSTDPRVGFIEQRVVLNRARLRGEPDGATNLARAANFVTLHSKGLRCLISENRMRFRSEVFLPPDEPLTRQTLSAHLHGLVGAWKRVVEPLRRVQSGAAWSKALAELAALSTDGGAGEAVIDDVELLLPAGWTGKRTQTHLLEITRDSAPARPIALTYENELRAWLLLEPWEPDLQTMGDLDDDQPAPVIDDLLAEINKLNMERPYAIAWDADGGVVARATLRSAERVPSAAQLQTFLEVLHETQAAERFDLD